MRFLFKRLVLPILFILFSTNLYANETFCLEEDGFIYPLFDEKECSKALDIQINKKEFSYIIEFQNKERKAKLEEYRINFEKIEEEKEKKLVNQEKEKKGELSGLEKRKKELEQKKIAKLAKEQKIKEERRIQKEKRIAEIKRKQEERKRKFKLRQEQQRKKRQELKNAKLKKKKELEKQRKLKKEEQIRKQIARKEEQKRKKIEREKKLKLAKIEGSKSSKKKEIIKKSDTVNDKLKVVFVDRKIVKSELLPSINPSPEIDYNRIDILEKESAKNLFSNNSNLILILPKDYETYANVVSEDQKTSQLVAGTKSLPNPDFDRLQMELRKAERELLYAQRMADEGFRRSQCMSCGLIVQWGGVAIQSKWNKEGNRIQSRISSLTSQFSSTPQYLEKEVLRNYNYVVQNVKAEKRGIFQIIQTKGNEYLEKELQITENKDFKISYNMDPQDKNYNNLINKYSTSEDMTRWQNQKILNISLKSFVDRINNKDVLKELSGKRELYSSLNLEFIKEKKSLFGSLFNFGKKKNNRSKTASISNSTSYELKDQRFESVVIVKTEHGLGSGFYIKEDEILTNYHVIEDSLSILITDKNKKKSSAVVIKKDLKRDLALLKTNLKGKPISFFSGQLKQGEMVEALGHPKGRKFSLTKGWISAIRKEGSVYNATGVADVLYIQTDAAINSGNSGGPLFYKNMVVGVNTQKLAGKSIEGMNFAVHFSEVQKFLSE